MHSESSRPQYGPSTHFLSRDVSLHLCSLLPWALFSFLSFGDMSNAWNAIAAGDSAEGGGGGLPIAAGACHRPDDLRCCGAPNAGDHLGCHMFGNSCLALRDLRLARSDLFLREMPEQRKHLLIKLACDCCLHAAGKSSAGLCSTRMIDASALSVTSFGLCTLSPKHTSRLNAVITWRFLQKLHSDLCCCLSALV